MSVQKNAPPGGGEFVPRTDFDFVCDSQNITISILRFAMKDSSVREILSYALDRLLGAPLFPLDGKGCVFTVDGTENRLVPQAEKNLSPEMLRRLADTGKSGLNEVLMSHKNLVLPFSPGGGDVLCVPIVYRGDIRGLMVLLLEQRGFVLSARGDEFLSSIGNMLAGVLAQKDAEREVGRIRKELRDAARLADIGALAASVAHELRSPLAVIKLACSNIRKKTGGNAIEKHICSIEKKVFECDRIINNLLFYARLKKPAVERFRIYDTINESISDSKLAARDKNVLFRKDLSSIKSLFVLADPVQIKEVFTNLLSNAVESIHEAGTVRVRARLGGSDELQITFADTGNGISGRVMGDIFSPFFTTKARGNGLGLAVSKSIINMHGGMIRVESKEGEGSVFTVFLPVRREAKV